MKLISVEMARSIRLFPMNELNPTGRSLTDIFQGLAKRYNFKRFPMHSTDLDQETKGLVFEGGEFTNRNGVLVIVKISLFNDGVVADCWSSTRDSDDLLRDAFEWLDEEYGLALPPDRSLGITHLSQLTVSPETHLASLLPKVQMLGDRLSQRLHELGQSNKGYVCSGFSLWARDWEAPGAPAPYRFELKLSSTIEENRYFTSAPLPTDSHIAILEEQERILAL